MGARRTPRREINYVKRILLISASVLLLVMLILPYFEKGPLFMVAGDLSKLFLTTYLAYMISEHFARNAAREELRDLGMTTGRRIFLHSAQLRELSDEVLSYEADGDRSKIYYNPTSTVGARFEREIGVWSGSRHHIFYRPHRRWHGYARG